DLNEFFAATGAQDSARFTHESEVQRWLDIIRGSNTQQSHELLRVGSKPPFPYSDVRLLPYLQHSFWFLPSVASCHAMANLLSERHNTFWREYTVVVAAGPGAGIGLNALPPVRNATRAGHATKTIPLRC